MVHSIENNNYCPVCGEVTDFYYEDKRRSYFSCPTCFAVHVPKFFHLSESAEKQEYDKHENRIDDSGYRKFLSRVADPLKQKLPPGAKGLDFGCGPGPALAHMLREEGCDVALYDKYYVPDIRVLKESYQFITTTEVVEHLSSPTEILDSLWQMLEPGGILAVMTKRVKDVEAFSGWHYKNDPTHIVFFHENTFAWLANRWQARLDFVSADVIFLTRLT